MSSKNVLVIPYEQTSSRGGAAAGARLMAGIIRAKGLNERMQVLEVEDADPAALTLAVLEKLRDLPAPRVIFGGNHLVSYPAMVDYVQSGGRRILVFDAHHDAYQMDELTHYSHLHHLVENFAAEVTVVGCSHEHAAADSRILMLPVRELAGYLGSGDERLYFSLDLGVMDATEFSSASHPMRGDMLFCDMLAAVRLVLRSRPECIDLVEASFAQHCSGRSMKIVLSLINEYLEYSSLPSARRSERKVLASMALTST